MQYKILLSTYNAKHIQNSDKFENIFKHKKLLILQQSTYQRYIYKTLPNLHVNKQLYYR